MVNSISLLCSKIHIYDTSAEAVLYECLTELSTLLFWLDVTLNLLREINLNRAYIWLVLSSDFVLELNKPGFYLQVTLGSSASWSSVYTVEVLWFCLTYYWVWWFKFQGVLIYGTMVAASTYFRFILRKSFGTL